MVLELRELVARLVLEFGVLFGFFVEFDVEGYKFVALSLFDCFLVAPFLVGDDHLTELCAPVAEVVDTDALVPGEFVEHLE